MGDHHQPTTERWGDLPSLSTAAMHDMLAAALTAAASSDGISSPEDDGDGGNGDGDRLLEGGGQLYPEANVLFSERRTAADGGGIEEYNREPTTSPFYETLKVLLKDTVIPEDDDPLEDPNTYTPNSKSLRDTVILIITHAGFSTASNHCIDILADLLQYYLEKFTLLLRQFTDSADFSSSTDFVDTFSKVLHHMSVPSFDALLQFNNELIMYEGKVKKKKIDAEVKK